MAEAGRNGAAKLPRSIRWRATVCVASRGTGVTSSRCGMRWGLSRLKQRPLRLGCSSITSPIAPRGLASIIHFEESRVPNVSVAAPESAGAAGAARAIPRSLFVLRAAGSTACSHGRIGWHTVREVM